MAVPSSAWTQPDLLKSRASSVNYEKGAQAAASLDPVSREEFVRLLTTTLQQEFPGDDGLVDLFMTVAWEPALNRSASVASMKKQIGAFVDLMGSEDLGYKGSRFRSVLEIFLLFPSSD